MTMHGTMNVKWRDSIGHNVWATFIFTSVCLVMCLMRSILFHRINSLCRTHPYINLPTEGSQSGFVKPGNSLRQMSHGTHQELNLQRKRENSPGYGTQAKSPFTIGVLFSYRQGTHQGEWNILKLTSISGQWLFKFTKLESIFNQ